ncbi:unnamed protein product [Cladocopium goreaui]|uniref:Uncharacterized protein n=1 Tax=Cladocopium goreaui TaxID=2562237 RepID=A0A9P1CR58_9DINO|nr:unnamed protein product [Cladocopium goreaui]
MVFSPQLGLSLAPSCLPLVLLAAMAAVATKAPIFGDGRRQGPRCALALGAAVAQRCQRCRRSSKRPRRAKKRRQSAFDPIVEYKRVQEDPLGSWGFLEEDDFAQRIVSFAAVAFVPSLLLSVAVFPPSNEDGIFLPNMLAAFSYGVGLTMAVTFILLLRISSFVDPLNKNLKATSYVVEDSRSQRSLAGDGGYYMERRQKTSDEIQRDQLLGEYQTGPAMSRLRKYLLGAAAVSALGWIVGSVSGGEMSLREDEEDERKCGTRCIPGLMTDDTNIEMNGYRLFR